MSKSTSPAKTVPITSASGKKKPRGRPFEPGNTMGKGRPKGSLNKTSLLVRELLSEHAEEITEKVIASAKAGDSVAVRVVMDRICPVRPGAPVTWDMPSVKFSEDLPAAYSSVLHAIASGELTPAEGLQVLRALEISAKELGSFFGFPWGRDPRELIKRLRQTREENLRVEETDPQSTSRPVFGPEEIAKGYLDD
jgi:hypothetical protein